MSWICDCKTCDCPESCFHPTGYIYPNSHGRCDRCKMVNNRKHLAYGFIRDTEPTIKSPAVKIVAVRKPPVDKPKPVVIERVYNEYVASEPSYYEVRKALNLVY